MFPGSSFFSLFIHLWAISFATCLHLLPTCQWCLSPYVLLRSLCWAQTSYPDVHWSSAAGRVTGTANLTHPKLNSLGFAKYAEAPGVPLLGMTQLQVQKPGSFSYFLLLSNTSSWTCLQVWFVLVPNTLSCTASPLFLLCQGLRQGS